MLKLVFTLVAAAFIILTMPGGEAAAEDPLSMTEDGEASGPEIGKTAPDFTGIDSKGATRTLSGFRGRTVVLEWTNPGCPFVRKHYDTGAMQTLQKAATDKGVVWLTINSAAEGKQGFMTPAQTNKLMKEEDSRETARIPDPDGMIGHLYHASATPHMFIIDPAGLLVYAGGIDDQPSVSHATIKTAHNYVRAALDDLAAGRQVQIATSKPYGCAVKY